MIVRKSVFLCCLLSYTTCPGADNWPSFQNGGHVSMSSGAKSEMQLSPELLWSVDLTGYGQSSPVVWKDRCYVTTVEGPQKETCLVTSFRIEDGSKLWQHSFENASPQENSTYISRAAPTPAADGDGAVCFFEGGNVIALTHDGQVRWERNLVADYGDVGARHGLSASVEQNEASVFVWVERSEDPYVVSLSKATGKTQWKAAGLGATSWASPRLVPVAGGHHLVLSAIGSLVGLDPMTGEILWRFDEISGNSTPTPVPVAEGRFLIGATVGRGESGGGRAAESNGVIEIQRDESGVWTAGYDWQAKRATSSFGSPIVHDGVAFFVNREGVLYGLDAADGKELFAKRISGSCWATPVGMGGDVFFFGKDGTIDVLSDIRQLQSVDSWDNLPAVEKPEAPQAEGGRGGSFSGPVLYAGVYCDGRFLLRRGNQLSAVAVVPKQK